MNTITLTEVLEYYDGIQVFSAQDPSGSHYVADLIDSEDGHGRYAVVGLPLENLKRLKAGKVDLRTAMLEASSGRWYIAVAKGSIEDPLLLEPQHKTLAETGYLPEKGYFLD